MIFLSLSKYRNKTLKKKNKERHNNPTKERKRRYNIPYYDKNGKGISSCNLNAIMQ